MDVEFGKEEADHVTNHIAMLRTDLANQLAVMRTAMQPPSDGDYLYGTFRNYAEAITSFAGCLLDIAEFLDKFMQGIDITARALSNTPTQDS